MFKIRSLDGSLLKFGGGRSMIQVSGLVKYYGPFRAVDNLSFTVPKGQILGFLGPNGAGKSTTMKMLTCFIEPSSGRAIINGLDTVKNSLAVRKLLGYLPESAPSYGEMRVSEFLKFIAEVRGLKDRQMSQAMSRVKEICSLSDVWLQPIETLSKGFRQRVGFAQALVHDPPILILDEPTDGLDPNQKHEVRTLIRSMAQAKTIVLSTHILEEVEAICERVVIIAKGRLVADATPEVLRRQSTSYNAVTVRFGGVRVLESPNLIRRLREVGRVEEISDHPGTVRVYPIRGEAIALKISELGRKESLTIEQLSVDTGRLDEVFRRVTMAETNSSVGQGDQ